MYQTVKGTYDLLPETFDKFQTVETLFRHFLDLYGYKEIKTPVFEYTGVFQKENDTSDMVTKEITIASTTTIQHMYKSYKLQK